MTNLDSANMILEKIKYPEKLSESRMVQYDNIKISFMMYVSRQLGAADSLNNKWLAHFIQQNDTTQWKRALLISGWISRLKNEPDRAIEQFQQMEELAADTPLSMDLCNCFYNLSHIYLDKQMNEKALHYAKKMVCFYEDMDTTGNMNNYKYIATIYNRMNQVDSALHYYQTILNVCTGHEKYQGIVNLVWNDLSEFYANQKKYKEALRYADLSIQHRTSRKDMPFFNLVKARVFIATHQIDSAKYYLYRIIHSSEDNSIILASYQHLSDLYNMTDDFEQAYFTKLNHATIFESNIRHIDSNVLMDNFQQEKLKNENNELKLAKRDQKIVFLSGALIGLFLFAILLFSFIVYRKKINFQKYRLKEEGLKAQTLLMENQNKLLRQENELMTLREKSAVLRESLFRKMSIATKIPSLKTSENGSSEMTSGNRICMEEADWNELIQTTNDLFYGFVTRLEKKYPHLGKDDVRFCCLIKINVSMNDLADIYCISKAGITKKKMRMKKDKLDIHDEAISLDNYLFSF